MDQEATWSKRHRDGWGYGHGAFGVVAPSPCRLGAFKSMRNRAPEATRRWLETGHLRGVMAPVSMDGKADAQALFAEFPRQSKMTLLTPPRNNRDPTVERQQMIEVLNQPQNRKRRQQRGQTGEPRQGVVKDLFARERCWMRGHRHNRGRFAAMGVTVQRHQARALNRQRSVWKITQEILGL